MIYGKDDDIFGFTFYHRRYFATPHHPLILIMEVHFDISEAVENISLWCANQDVTAVLACPHGLSL